LFQQRPGLRLLLKLLLLLLLLLVTGFIFDGSGGPALPL
jgi:hypothetical protein